MYTNYLIVAFLSALIVISWQCFKDPAWEGFSLFKLFRSFILSFIVAATLYLLSFYNRYFYMHNLGILLLVILCFERALGEIYKSVFKKRHAEYQRIFRHFGLSRRLLINKLLLLLTLIILYALAFIVFSSLPLYLQDNLHNKYLTALLSGLLGGVFIAVGGALKDSSFEPFNLLKFFRSPLVGLLAGALLVNFVSDIHFLIFACMGLERIIVEGYKTLYLKSVRGVFNGKKPVYKHWLKIRWIFNYTYILGVLGFLYYLFF